MQRKLTQHGKSITFLFKNIRMEGFFFFFFVIQIRYSTGLDQDDSSKGEEKKWNLNIF